MLNQPSSSSNKWDKAKQSAKDIANQAKNKSKDYLSGDKLKELSKSEKVKRIGSAALGGLAALVATGNMGNMMEKGKQVNIADTMDKMALESRADSDRGVANAKKSVDDLVNSSSLGQKKFSEVIKTGFDNDVKERLVGVETENRGMASSDEFPQSIKDSNMAIENDLKSSLATSEADSKDLTSPGNKIAERLKSMASHEPFVGGQLEKAQKVNELLDSYKVNKESNDIAIGQYNEGGTADRLETAKEEQKSANEEGRNIAGIGGAVGLAIGEIIRKKKEKKPEGDKPEPNPEPEPTKINTDTGYTAAEYGPKEAPKVTVVQEPTEVSPIKKNSLLKTIGTNAVKLGMMATIGLGAANALNSNGQSKGFETNPNKTEQVNTENISTNGLSKKDFSEKTGLTKDLKGYSNLLIDYKIEKLNRVMNNKTARWSAESMELFQMEIDVYKELKADLNSPDNSKFNTTFINIGSDTLANWERAAGGKKNSMVDKVDKNQMILKLSDIAHFDTKTTNFKQYAESTGSKNSVDNLAKYESMPEPVEDNSDTTPSD